MEKPETSEAPVAKDAEPRTVVVSPRIAVPAGLSPVLDKRRAAGYRVDAVATKRLGGPRLQFRLGRIDACSGNLVTFMTAGLDGALLNLSPAEQQAIVRFLIQNGRDEVRKAALAALEMPPDGTTLQ